MIPLFIDLKLTYGDGKETITINAGQISHMQTPKLEDDKGTTSVWMVGDPDGEYISVLHTRREIKELIRAEAKRCSV